MLEIILIRHGQTDWNRERRIMGRRPIPLNGEGRRQSLAVARSLRGLAFNAIYTSPARRALETARFIAEGALKNTKGSRTAPGKGKVPMVETGALAEIEYGDWVGKTFDEVTGQGPYLVYHTTPKRAHPPGGEKMTDAQRRAVRLIEKLRGKYRTGGRVVVVSHADIIKAILLRYLRLDLNELLRLRIDNGSLSLLWFNGTRERVLAINCPPLPGGLFAKTDQLPVPQKR